MNDDPKDVADDADVEGHAINTQPGGPGGPGQGGIGGRFRPDEDEMFGDDVEGHAIDTQPGRPPPHRFRPDEDEMFGQEPRPS